MTAATGGAESAGALDPTGSAQFADYVFVASLVGRTIVRAEWKDRSPDQEWAEHEYALLWLNDGRVIEFGSWGHDAWGAEIREVDVDEGEKAVAGGQHVSVSLADLGLVLDFFEEPRRPRTLAERQAADRLRRASEDLGDSGVCEASSLGDGAER